MDYSARLEQEMANIVKPKITNLGTASVEDVVKDLHRVITGNGDPMHGLHWRTALLSADIKYMRERVQTTEDADNKRMAAQQQQAAQMMTMLAEQISRCKAIQDSKKTQNLPAITINNEQGGGKSDAKEDDASAVLFGVAGKFLIKNWKPVTYAVVGALAYILHIRIITTTSATNDDERFQRLQTHVDRVISTKLSNGQHADNLRTDAGK